MDKNAQAAREARLAQALRTNLRRRKAADPPKPAPDAEPAPQAGASPDTPAT